MDIKFKVISGVASVLAISSLYMFYREGKKTLNQKLLDQMEELRKFINYHFEDCTKEQLSQRIEDRKELVNFLFELIQQFSDITRVNEEITHHPFFKKLDLQNQQIVLFNQEYTSLYLRRNSLDGVFQYLQQITPKSTINQEEPKLSENTSKFISFFYIFFINFIKFIEEVLLNPGEKHGLIQMNFMLSGLLDLIEQILKQYPLLTNLIGIALMGQLQINEPQIQFGHKCTDYFDAKIDENQQNDCKCLIIDALLRYVSLITPTLQKKFITILVDFGVLQSQQHLIKLGQILLKNVFFMNSQISKDSMYYVADVSVFNHLLIQTTAYSEIRKELAQPELLDNYFLYLERVLSQNSPKFISKILPSLIASHVMIYPLFGDKESLKNLILEEKQQILISVHFLGILLILETKETVDVNQNQQMLDWLAQNMDYMLAIEVLTFLQKQFLLQIFKQGNQELILKQYLQCLRVTHNKRIQNRQQQKKQFEITACLQQIIGYLVGSLIKDQPNKQTIQKIINLIPFQDQNEQSNIFSNILRIIFDLPTINFHFLKFVQPKCEKLSQESLLSYQGYYTHILTAQTVSYDSYMFSLQLSLLFGKAEALLTDNYMRMCNDFKDFDRYEDFLTRDIILLIDLIENPYYLMNILMQTGTEFPNKKQIEKQLYQYAAITILKLNEGLNRKQLLASLSMFVYLQQLPDYIMELVDESEQGQLKLRPQYNENYPYLSLQKDMGSVQYFLEKCEQPFDELMYAPESFEFLFEIRQQLFKCESFCNIIKLCLESNDRMKLQIWIGKLLYYAKQTLLKKGGDLVESLLKSESCQSFIKELEHNKLVQYLQQ